MKNGIFQFDWGSIADAVIMAALTAFVVGLASIVTIANFDVFTADWITIGKNMTNLAFIAGVVSLAQNFLSTKKGSLLNVTPENADKKG